MSKREMEIYTPYPWMYTTLYMAVTEALRMMESGELDKACAGLIKAQQEAEDMFTEVIFREDRSTGAGVPWWFNPPAQAQMADPTPGSVPPAGGSTN